MLFKIKEYAEAKTWAENAIAIGKKNNVDVSETQRLVDKINSARK
ncbi:MAG: hypothetical protein ACK4IY_09505 [Chitinophagales bacterium]